MDKELRKILSENGFDKYIELFEVNNLINSESISALSETGMKYIGITAIEDRKNLLKLFPEYIKSAHKRKIHKLTAKTFSIFVGIAVLGLTFYFVIYPNLFHNNELKHYTANDFTKTLDVGRPNINDNRDRGFSYAEIGNFSDTVDFASMSDEAYIAYGTRRGWLRQIKPGNMALSEYFPGFEVICPAKKCTIIEIDKNIEFFKWYTKYNKGENAERIWFFEGGNSKEYPSGGVTFLNGNMLVAFFSSNGPEPMANFARFLGNLSPANVGDNGVIFGRTIQEAKLNNIEVISWTIQSMFGIVSVACTVGLKEGQ